MKTLVELLHYATRQWPDHTALVMPGKYEVTYRELQAEANRWTSLLLCTGVKPGEHVALLSRNGRSYVAAYFGILQTGAVVVPVNYSLDARAIRDVVHDSQARYLVQEKALGMRVPELEHVQRWNLDEVAKIKCVDAPHVAELKSSDLASIVYTSGSTSSSLGVMLSHENLMANNLAIVEYMRLSCEDSVLCILPWYYIYGLSLLLSHIAVGAAVVLENGFLYPQVVANRLETSRVTGFAGVSSHFSLLIQQTDFLEKSLPDLRYFQHAGDKMPVATTGKLIEAFAGKELYLMYGQTEAAPRLSYLHPSKTKTKTASVGEAIPGVRIRVVREDGTDCAIDEEGEVIAAGPNIMQGYWKHSEETAEVLRDGWLYTGDLGHLDAAGDLFITGRKKLFLKVGGRRFSPAEIENLCLEFPGVAEAVAIGVPDQLLGQRLKLFIVTRANVEIRELLAFFKQRVPSYKVPSEIEAVKQLPKKFNGKVDRKKLAMVSRAYTPPEAIVSQLNVERGDLLLVGSDVLQLALRIREAGGRFDAHAFINDLLAALGPQGTLLFPTFNFDFCKSKPFDVRKSPTAMGALPRTALARDDFRRTRHPIHSFVVAGACQRDICELTNISSFGVGSPFEYLHRNGGKMLIIGMKLQGCFTFAHYVEECEGVDYRYSKDFRSVYVDEAGHGEERTYSSYVRDLNRGVESDLNPMEETLIREKVVTAVEINGVSFKQLRLRDSYPFIARDIRENAGRSLYRLKPRETTVAIGTLAR